MTATSSNVPNDTVRSQIFSSIAIVSTQLQEISSNRCGRYMLRYHGSVFTGASSSIGADDLYEMEYIPSPLEVSAISDMDAFCCMASYLASDLLGSYQALLTIMGIPLCDIGGHINHIFSCTIGP